jgi:hypothetical protein
MALRVVGAGVGRTGTLSLKAALEQLLGGPCYHMLEVFEHPPHVALWRQAASSSSIDWDALVGGYVATTDFPACLFWPELMERHPDAIVLLSTRRDTKTWWESASQTIFAIDPASLPGEMEAWYEMWSAIATARFTEQTSDETAACAAYERHNAAVRSAVPPGRLVEWSPGDGWAPLCDALGVPVPAEPFPHLNTRADFPKVTADTSVDEALESMRPERGLGRA